MAITTVPSELVSASACYDCIPENMQGPVLIYILASIAGLTGQTTAQLMASAKCYACLSQKDQSAVMTYLLNQIVNNGSGVSGSGVTCGTDDPVDAPSGSCGLYVRTDNGNVWYWDGAAWQPLVA